MNKKLIIVGGVFNFFVTILHLFLWKQLNWAETLSCLSEVNRVVMYMLNNHVTLAAFIFFYISVFHYRELVSTKLGKVMLLSMSVFYFLRGAEDFIYFEMKNIFTGFYFLLPLMFIAFGFIYLVPFVRSMQGKQNKVKIMKGLYNWGMEDGEETLVYPCDEIFSEYDSIYFRAVSVKSSPEKIYKWLCQMKVGPYSYDFVDNFGQKSPSSLTPGLDQLEIGQDVMEMFSIVHFEKNKSITYRIKNNSSAMKVYGDVIGSYVIIPKEDNLCRLIVKIMIKYPSGLMGVFMKRFLPFGDLIMMRKQLLNFKKYSEKEVG